MSHEFTSGMSVREVPWHGLGEVLEDYPENWDEARKFAGLEWEPALEPVYAKQIKIIDGEPVEVFEPIPGFNRVIRNDTFETLALPRDTFDLIYHYQMGELLEAFTGETNLRFETAVNLQGGRKVAALVRLDEPFQIPGDNSPTYPFAVLLNAHDGEGACKLSYTNVRVVCMNTFNAADMLSERTPGTSVVLRHTKNVQERVAAAKQAAADMRSGAAAWQELAQGLLDIKVDTEFELDFITEFIPSPPTGVISDRVAKNIQEARDAVWQCLYSKTVNEEIRGTGYALIQAAGEYLDHLRGYKNRETYLGRTMLKPEPLKARAVKIVRELAEERS
jgi:phage/plasmid-like protein (TIGR03299 family)